MYFLHVFQNKQGYQNDGHIMFPWTTSDLTESRNTSCVLLLNFLFVVLELPVCLQRRGLILQRAVGLGQLHPRVLCVCHRLSAQCVRTALCITGLSLPVCLHSSSSPASTTATSTAH